MCFSNNTEKLYTITTSTNSVFFSSTLTRSFIYFGAQLNEGEDSDLAHGLSVDEVLVAPDAGVVVVLPLRVDVEVGEVVALRHRELLPHLVALLLPALRRRTQIQQTVNGSVRKRDDIFLSEN